MRCVQPPSERASARRPLARSHSLVRSGSRGEGPCTGRIGNTGHRGHGCRQRRAASTLHRDPAERASHVPSTLSAVVTGSAERLAASTIQCRQEPPILSKKKGERKKE